MELEYLDGVRDVLFSLGRVDLVEASASVVLKVLHASQFLKENVSVEDRGDPGAEGPDEISVVLAGNEDGSLLLARQAVGHLE